MKAEHEKANQNVALVMAVGLIANVIWIRLQQVVIDTEMRLRRGLFIAFLKNTTLVNYLDPLAIGLTVRTF